MNKRESILVAFFKMSLFTFLTTFVFVCLVYIGVAVWGYYKFSKWHLDSSIFEKSFKVAVLGTIIMVVVGLITKITELREKNDREGDGKN